MKSFIGITTSFEGYHYYEDAPEEVAYLRYTHRHIFHIEVLISVEHNDREIEFHMFKNYINKFLKEKNLNHLSCEMISDKLYDAISFKFPNREIRIKVSEDGENFSYKEYE